MSPRRLAGVVLLVGLAVPAAGTIQVDRVVEQSSCGDWVTGARHRFLESTGEVPAPWIDADARDWQLDFPIEYLPRGNDLVADERFRVGDGQVRIRVRLMPERGRFDVTIAAQPEGDFDSALAQYLPGLGLPCEASGRLDIERDGAPARDARAPDRIVRSYRLLHRAAESLYEPDFEATSALLEQAERLAPESDEVRWREARLHFLVGESLAPDDREGRLAAFGAAERAADSAVELAPDHAEGWFWRAVARGRILTTQGNLHVVLSSLLHRDDRGPRWVAECFERAIALGPTYETFGYSALADTLYGAALMYRLTPRGFLVRRTIGIEGDLDRSVELLRRAIAIQPDRIEYAKELGVSLLCRGATNREEADVREARRILRHARSLPVHALYDRIDFDHVSALLAAPPEKACVYSRDGWQDGTGVVEAGL